VVLVAFAVVAMLLGMTGAATVVGEALPGKLKNNRSGLRCLILGIVVFAVVVSGDCCLGWPLPSAWARWCSPGWEP